MRTITKLAQQWVRAAVQLIERSLAVGREAEKPRRVTIGQSTPGIGPARQKYDDAIALKKGEGEGDGRKAEVRLQPDDITMPDTVFVKQIARPFDRIEQIAVGVAGRAFGNRLIRAAILHAREQTRKALALRHQLTPPRYSTWPVTKSLSSRRKKSMALVTSSNVPMRFTA